MKPSDMPWWELEKLLTQKDRDAISRAKELNWDEIDENDAETEFGKYELHVIACRKYHNEEYHAGML